MNNRFSELFIRRPVATTLLTIGIALAGLLAFAQLPVSPLPQVDFPNISVSATMPGAQPRQHGVRRRRAAGAPSRADRRRQRDDLDELARLDAHPAAIRPRPRHRRRGARRPGGDQRRARRLADQPALQSDLPQDQSRRRADHGAGADLDDAHGRTDLRHRLQRVAAAAVAARRHRRGRRRRQRAAGGAGRAQSRRAVQIRHRPRGHSRRARRRQRQQPEGRDRGRRLPLSDLRQRPGEPRPTNIAISSSPTATTPPSACPTSPKSSIRSRICATPGFPTASRRSPSCCRASPAPTSSRRSTASKRNCRAWPPRCRATSISTSSSTARSPSAARSPTPNAP